MPSPVEPVQPTGAPTGPVGRIIQLDRWVGRQRSRRVASPPPLRTEPTPQQDLAITLEAMFLHHDRTLSDEATADAFRLTLDTVLLMLDGSRAEQLVGEEEYRHLAGMIHGMRGAPDAL